MKVTAKCSEARHPRERPLGRMGAMILVLAIMATASAQAGEQANYFPLQSANRWVYLLAGPIGWPRREEVRTTTDSQFGGQATFEMENYLFGFFPASVTFFNTESGTLELAAEGRTGMWYPWSNLSGADVPVTLPPFAMDCVHGSEGSMAIGDRVVVPAGVFENVAVITYRTHPCEDQAVLSEVMAPGVGLIQRQVLTFAGLQTWSLEHAEVDGRVYGRLSSNENRAAGRAGGALSSLAPGEASTWGAIKAAFHP